jgi:hypothetical protein
MAETRQALQQKKLENNLRRILHDVHYRCITIHEALVGPFRNNPGILEDPVLFDGVCFMLCLRQAKSNSRATWGLHIFTQMREIPRGRRRRLKLKVDKRGVEPETIVLQSGACSVAGKYPLSAVLKATLGVTGVALKNPNDGLMWDKHVISFFATTTYPASNYWHGV